MKSFIRKFSITFLFLLKVAGYSAIMFFVSFCLEKTTGKEIIKSTYSAISWFVCWPLIFALPYSLWKNE